MKRLQTREQVDTLVGFNLASRECGERSAGIQFNWAGFMDETKELLEGRNWSPHWSTCTVVVSDHVATCYGETRKTLSVVEKRFLDDLFIFFNFGTSVTSSAVLPSKNAHRNRLMKDQRLTAILCVVTRSPARQRARAPACGPTSQTSTRPCVGRRRWR